MISDFVKLRGPRVLSPGDAERLRSHLVACFVDNQRLPARGGGIDWRALAFEAGVDEEALVAGRDLLRPGLEALRRELRKPVALKGPTTSLSRLPPPQRTSERRHFTPAPAALPVTPTERGDAFEHAIDREMHRQGETARGLARSLREGGVDVDASTIRTWRMGAKAPGRTASVQVLERLEARWELPSGHFRRLLPAPGRALAGRQFDEIAPAERRRLAWHLPDDFDRRPSEEREAIVDWVRRVVISGTTDYRRYQSAATRHRFALRFSAFRGIRGRPCQTLDPERRSGSNPPAPPRLDQEMTDLVEFKTATLTTLGFRRRGVWSQITADQRIEHFALMFGALCAPTDGPVRGAGAPVDSLSFAMLTLPKVWDWYLQWRERRRGFYTNWEVDMLSLSLALTAPETGWLTQRADLAERVQAIPGLVREEEAARVRQDWAGACEALHRYALARSKEIDRIARVHRDPFEPILPILEAPSPVGEYRKIADEVLAYRPCPRRYPKAAAESSRAFLMIRFGLHLGFRQKNLRQLLVCPRGVAPRTERTLTDLARGELRWSDRDGGWEVFVPSCAFKNARSSFFGGRPFRLLLPDIAGLYEEIDAYIADHRGRLLRSSSDPGTFFVKSAKHSSQSGAYNQTTFFEAWRWTIQRYGIFNPYTGRGAIEGLLPHGPHNVRDVLATHILKKTGSYEQASYAIQDTPETVAQHYGRFLPQDKAAMAAQVLNRAWEAG